MYSPKIQDLDHTSSLSRKIDTVNSEPLKTYPYRILLAKRKVFEEEI